MKNKEKIENLSIHGFIHFEYKSKEFQCQIRNFDGKELELEFVEVWNEKECNYIDYCKFDYETQEIYKEAIKQVKKIFIKR